MEISNLKWNSLALVLVVAFAALLVAGCTSPSAQTGRAVFTISDAAADMGNVTSVLLTVDSVEAHNNATGWVTVMSTQKTYDLLQLKASGVMALLADVNLSAGTYQQIRLNISKVVIVDANVSHDAKLPSSELKIVGKLVVSSNSTAIVNLDFIVDRSLHVTGNGSYILAPVVKLETRENATVRINARNETEVDDGEVSTDIEVGMDENGEVGIGKAIAAGANISIENGRVKVNR